MSQVLSQQEIDALMSNVKSGQALAANENNAEPVPYTFQMPNRISKNQLKTIQNIHENFAENFSSYLTSKLGSLVPVNLKNIDQVYYSEYMLSVSNPGCLFTFEINTSEIKGIIEFNIDLALGLIDRLLGGNGNGTKQNKSITSIEQKVLEVVIEKMLEELKRSWVVVDNLNFKLVKFETDIDFVQITPQNESVLLVPFEIVLGEKSFVMNISIATYSFDSILSKISSQNVPVTKPVKTSSGNSKELLSAHISQTYLPLTVLFGKAKISMQELLAMQTGDIVKLETKVSDEHQVKVGTKVLYTGRAGVLNNHKAIKITHKVNTEKKR